MTSGADKDVPELSAPRAAYPGACFEVVKMSLPGAAILTNGPQFEPGLTPDWQCTSLGTDSSLLPV